MDDVILGGFHHINSDVSIDGATCSLNASNAHSRCAGRRRSPLEDHLRKFKQNLRENKGVNTVHILSTSATFESFEGSPLL